MTYFFPSGFEWGVSTASYQIEGAAELRGRSVWDTFSETPGRVLNGDTGAIACDHFHRYRDDIALMAELGVRHYRFSISWPRVMPEGRGAVNEGGLAFYERLVDCLLEYGITPHATLFHWDSPQALEDRYGSWRSREMAQDFADYATVVVGRLCDRISHWMTINEIFCFTHMGYGVNQVPLHAPGTTVKTAKETWQTSHHALLAHGLGCQAIRAASRQPCSIALVDNFLATVPFAETPEHIAAAQTAFHTTGTNGGIVFPALTGEYSPLLLERLGSDAPDIRPGDLETIHQPLDAFGFNVYSGSVVRAADNDQGYETLDFRESYPRLHMPWLWVVPDGLYWGVRHISETLNRPDLRVFISENGCAAQDEVNSQGEILDLERIFYLRQYLQAAHRATAEGYPLTGYFLWSFMDNFEWAWGCDRRFGITYVDYSTQQRIPKASFHWYADCVRENRVV
ncbi:GH1 family beta-glucosidase [Pseudanabaena sp. FACHB-2040]|uniref:GH1 family beta-glucosidase n=1 Tax=Pseudanabaena sp. FACHB-2040 TaxID=2692859 RepID=UPI001683202C|nr:GH1 family beta-glucosidase [Pseudanabaena sp. FACHB-2040]MBD2260938.1 beta-glucosidase [Pseudanabaena sp. FACHB-2040]